MRRHREREPHAHAGRVALDGRVEEALHAREVDDLVEARGDLGAPHAEDRAVEVDVLAARELGVEAGAHLEQAADAAAQLDAPRRRLGDARQDLEQRALARAVAADDAEHLAAPHLEVDVAQRPDRFAPRRAPAPAPQRSAQRGAERLPERRVALRGADPEALAESLDANGGFAHGPYTRSAKVRSMRRKKNKPPTSSAAMASVELASSSQGGLEVPSSAQRKPSITPAIGLSP